MKSILLVLLVAFSLIISGCMSMKPTDRVVSKPAVGPARGPVYYLPLTALTGTVSISIVEYELVPPGGTAGSKGNKKFYAAEIPDDVKIESSILPDPDQRYCIQSEDLSDNPFLLSKLSFETSGLGLLTGVSATVEDHTLDAIAAAVKLAGNIVRSATGLPSVAPPDIRVSSEPLPDKSSLTEVKRSAIQSSFMFIPVPGAPAKQMCILQGIPEVYNNMPISYTDTLTVTVKGAMQGGGVPAVIPCGAKASKIKDARVCEPGIFYRTPKYMEVVSTIVHDFGGPGKTKTTALAAYKPLMQFGDINSLAVQAKRFTNRTTTAAFENGALTKYGVESEDSATNVLNAVNGVLAEARTIQSELAAAKEEERTERLAEQKNRFNQLKKLQEFYACTQTSGCDSTQKLTALIESILGFSDE